MSAGRRSSPNSQPIGSEILILQETVEAGSTQVQMEGKKYTPEPVFPSIYGTAVDRARNLVVTVLVEGNPVLAVMGTAAQVTVVNARKAQEWVRGKDSIPSFLREIGDRPVPERKVRNVCFTIGDNPYTGDLNFADIEEDMLLGIDFLAKNKAVNDLGRQEVRSGDQVIVAGLVREGVEYTVGCRVRLIGRTRAPVNSTTHAVAPNEAELHIYTGPRCRSLSGSSNVSPKRKPGHTPAGKRYRLSLIHI